jgi:hypothetical protein
MKQIQNIIICGFLSQDNLKFTLKVSLNVMPNCFNVLETRGSPGV